MRNPYVLLLIAMILYAGNLIVGKPVVNQVPPFTLTLLRYTVAFAVVLPLGFTQWKYNQPLWKKEWKGLILLSLSGLVMFNGLVYLALRYTTSINAAIVESSTPIFAFLLGFLFMNERFRKIQLAGVLLSLVGVFIVITEGSKEIITTLSFNPGDLIMLAAMVAWSFYSIFIKQHMWKFPAYGGLLVMFVIAIVFLVPLSLLESSQWGSIEWSWGVVSGLIYLGVFPSLVALIAYNAAIKEIGPSQASIFLNFIPVFTVIGAVIFLGEKLMIIQLIGSALVISGVLITTRKAPEKHLKAR